MKNVTTKEKKKVGKPKKKENTNLNQIKMNTLIKNIKNKEHNNNARDGMDLDK